MLVPKALGGGVRVQGIRRPAFVSSHAALRSPLTLSSPFTASFSLGSHSALNGDLSVPSSYVSLHLSPQVSGSVVYGRSPMVSPQCRCQEVSAGPKNWRLGGKTSYTKENKGLGKGGESWLGECTWEGSLRVSVVPQCNTSQRLCCRKSN